MWREIELGVDSVCCLLHNLIPGGSARQWIHLLGRHVEDGGRAMIVAPRGPLSEVGRAAGIAMVDRRWSRNPLEDRESVHRLVSGHDVAIVHWDHLVMHAFEPALSACGRAALVLHQTPATFAGWFGPQNLPSARVSIDRAIEEPGGVVLVRGPAHARRVAEQLDLSVSDLGILPASIPVPPRPSPAEGRPEELLALTRLSHEKAAIVRLAADMARARLDRGLPCRLSVAGEGGWREEALSYCERSLPARAWRLEIAPCNPIARLAASDLVVGQGQTALEAAALERRIVIAPTVEENRAGGVVLTPERYDVAVRDPWSSPPLLSTDPEQLWREAEAVDAGELRALRALVERHNSLEAGAGALREALAGTA